MTDPMLLSPVEAARVLGIGRSSLYLLMQSGDLASVRIGRSRKIPVAALDEFVHRLRDDASPITWPQREGSTSA
jgi:excisionase family DNA binding protein